MKKWLNKAGIYLIAGVLVFFVFASMVTPVVVYLTMLILSIICIRNMLAIRRICGITRGIKSDEEDEMDKPPEPPYTSREVKNAIHKGVNFIRKGYGINEIKESLTEKYEEPKADWILHMIKQKTKEVD